MSIVHLGPKCAYYLRRNARPLSLVVVAVTLASCGLSRQQLSRSAPNFVFVLADDMGWGDASYNNDSSTQHHPGAGNRSWLVP